MRLNIVSNTGWSFASSIYDLPINLHDFSLIFKNCVILLVLIRICTSEDKGLLP